MLRSVTEYLDATAKQVPEKIAFESKWDSLTFAELRDASRRVATGLVMRGVFRQPVAVFMEKSAACVSVFLGAAYSGNFYTPLDVKMPTARIEKILTMLEPSVIIAKAEHLLVAETFANGAQVLCYEELQTLAVDEIRLMEMATHFIDVDVLYVVFTSGSTGMPKGVIMSHRSVINYIEWIVKTFSFNEATIIGNQSPLYFDLSIQDVYATIKTGCTTYLMEANLFSFPSKLFSYMAEKAINTIVWVPSALCVIANLKGLQSKTLPSLEKILFCGEVMPNKQLNIWRKAYPNAIFVNLYGPTEACDAMAYYIIDREFSDDEVLPIGQAIDNVEILLLDNDNKSVAFGERGELCIRGVALAYGYWNAPEKTQTAFVQNPLQNGYPEIIYRTGDIVEYNDKGELVYLCRKDFQIKHMGHRIELGEIETVTSSLDGMQQNCCLYDEQKGHIVLFYTGTLEEEELGQRLCGLLPAYMLPARRKKLAAMPLNLNGKIDRVALKRQL